MGTQRHNVIPTNASFCLVVRYTTINEIKVLKSSLKNKINPQNFTKFWLKKNIYIYILVKCLYMVQIGNQTYKNLFKKITSFYITIFYQIWLNLFKHDHHFGYIEKIVLEKFFFYY